ncbi:MAG TPA: hypothetical protein VFI42_16820 [Thermomicrobiaceae bacterium]|nr:hypothetical protein [Thermomicrobiaceae bacterium]
MSGAAPTPEEPIKRQVQFAGRLWDIRQGAGGGNHFEATNVVVDVHGRLFLGIARHAGQWTSAEIVLAEPAGYGEYAIVVDSPLTLPRNVVLSFALRRDDEHELAIQLSPWWGRPSNAQFLVQEAGNLPEGWLETFRLPAERAPTEHVLRWSPEGVEFASYDAQPRLLRGRRLVHEARLDLELPPDGYHLAVGLWLFRGEPPGDGRDQRLWVREVAVKEL